MRKMIASVCFLMLPATQITADNIGWGSTDVRYSQGTGAETTSTMKLTVWKGERASAMVVVKPSATRDSMNVSGQIKGLNLRTALVQYVMTDGLKPDGKGGCGYRQSTDYDSSMVADRIDTDTRYMAVKAHCVQPYWVSIDVPQDARAGHYSGYVTVADGQRQLARLPIQVEVRDRVLPPPQEWTFHLDLWQNPYAVARYYDVEPFSDEHFSRMRPIMMHYADAGGKVITASITHRPWNGQTYDPFESMVTWLRRADGTWWYDYTVFDRWVEFMMSQGVRQQINCYSMVPWRLSFQYFDQATNSMRFIKCKPGDKEYEDFWCSMLTDFARHLKEKGWFEITHIAMDERSLTDMLATLRVIRKADPEFKVALAGSYHKELATELDDYCITLSERFPDDVLAARKAAGQVSTYYTCCQERVPNTFTFSAPAEAEWLGWHAAKEGLDGYLRWALNSWVKDPVNDSRFTAWPAGDTYLLYPDGHSSVRMEKLREGIQQYEKVRLLRQTLNDKQLARLKKVLELFDELKVYDTPPAEAIRKAREMINTW